MSRCLPSSRRTRASVPPRPKYHVFISFKMPDVVDDKEREEILGVWAKEFLKKYHRLPSTFEVRKYLENKYLGKYDDWDGEYSLSLETTRYGATLWQMGESIDDYISYRNPSPPPHMTEYMYYIVNKNEKCLICLEETNGDDTVALSACHCIYHKKCIEKSYNYSTRCPICTREIEEIIALELDDYNPIEIVDL